MRTLLRPVYRLSGDDNTSPSLQLPLTLTRTGALRTTTVELLQTMEELFRPISGAALAAAGIVLEAPLEGHTCLDAGAISERLLVAQAAVDTAAKQELSYSDAPNDVGTAAPPSASVVIPESADAVRNVFASADALCLPWDAVHASYPPDAPIVEAFGNYYPHRFAVTEQRIAQALVPRAQARTKPPRDREALLAALPNSTNPAQRAAVEASLEQHFMLLTGGPGTGKTWTVRLLLAVKIAAALREGDPLPEIALAAPTGKAAARVVESLSDNLDVFLDTVGRELVDNNEDQLAQLRQALSNPNARTLHRLLGLGGPTSTRPETLFVNADIVVVDEVSMVDATMMAQLFEALAEDTTLILIGDPNQLASVDAGTALADLVDLCKLPGSPLRENLVELIESRRFTDDSVVGKLAHAALLSKSDSPLWPEWVETLSDQQALPSGLVKTFAQGYGPLMQAAGATAPLDPELASDDELNARAEDAFKALSKFQVLTSHRVGGRSVAALNDAISTWLVANKKMQNPQNNARERQQPSRTFPVGTPVMVLKNDYSLQRFNGDIGVVIARGMVSFEEPDGSVSHIAAIRLPEHTSAFAITVHKSQGSEWDEVAFLLPNHVSRLLTRELVYTAISRAKETIRIYGALPVLQAAIQNPAKRATGLVKVVGARIKHKSGEV